MKITALEEYGLRCLLQLARHTGPEPLTVSAVSESEGLSVPYVSKLMSTLRQEGLVESVRGRSGGFILSRPANQITVGQAMNALGGQLFEPQFCSTHHGSSDECVHLTSCSIRSLWGVLGRIINQVLDQTSIADLADSEQPCKTFDMTEKELLELLNNKANSASVSIPLLNAEPTTQKGKRS
jgi:Rrf2 family protein